MNRATLVCCAVAVTLVCVGCAAQTVRGENPDRVFEAYDYESGPRNTVARLVLRGDGTFRYRVFPLSPWNVETPPRPWAYEGVWRQTGRSLVFRIDRCLDLAGDVVTTGAEGALLRGYSSDDGVGFCARQVDDIWTDPLWLFTHEGGPLTPAR